MYRIVRRQELAPKIVLFEIEAPEVARKRKPGQFVIVRVHEHGERVPLSIADENPEKGTITLIVQEVGRSTARLNAKQAGDTLPTVVGPLGKPTEIHRLGRVACVGGGVGIAPLHPIARAFKHAGNTVISILGGRAEPFLILRDEIARVSDQTILCTDDGSLGLRGVVTAPLRQLLESDEKPDAVIAVGPPIMMKKVSELTREFRVPTTVSLNSLMVDGTGMCGGCRITVGGEIKFVCVDGPEFDGHQVDFDEMLNRLAMYKEMESLAYRHAHADPHSCKLDAREREIAGR
jgi:ferredoxin--NADP+ reductase